MHVKRAEHRAQPVFYCCSTAVPSAVTTPLSPRPAQGLGRRFRLDVPLVLPPCLVGVLHSIQRNLQLFEHLECVLPIFPRYKHVVVEPGCLHRPLRPAFTPRHEDSESSKRIYFPSVGLKKLRRTCGRRREKASPVTCVIPIDLLDDQLHAQIHASSTRRWPCTYTPFDVRRRACETALLDLVQFCSW